LTLLYNPGPKAPGSLQRESLIVISVARLGRFVSFLVREKEIGTIEQLLMTPAARNC
jgi:hypothetical protein